MSRLLPFLLILIITAFFTKLDFFFYLVYVLFGVYFIGHLWARRSLAAVRLDRLHDERVFLGEPFKVKVQVRNTSWLPVLWLRLTDSVPAELTSGTVFRRVVSLKPHESLDLEYDLHGRRRGYYRIGPLVSVGGDLLGSRTYEHREAEEDNVIVYPKIIRLREMGLPSQSPFGTLASRERIYEDPTRILGVREYQPGDSLRRMDWKTSARVGALQVRRYEPAISLETAIFLNLNGDDYAHRHRYQATEMGIVVAASIAAHLIEKRQAVGLFTNGNDPFQESDKTDGTETLDSAFLPREGRGHLMQLLDLLARIKADFATEASPGEDASAKEAVSLEEGGQFLELLNCRTLGLTWGSTVVIITAREVEGLLHTLLTLRRRGLATILVLTCPDRALAHTVQRTAQIGVQSVRIWSEQDMDVWR